MGRKIPSEAELGVPREERGLRIDGTSAGHDEALVVGSKIAPASELYVVVTGSSVARNIEIDQTERR